MLTTKTNESALSIAKIARDKICGHIADAIALLEEVAALADGMNADTADEAYGLIANLSDEIGNLEDTLNDTADALMEAAEASED